MKVGFWFLILIIIATIVSIWSFTLSSSQQQDAINIDLNEKANIEQIQQNKDVIDEVTNDNLLRIAISGVLSPSKTLEYYQELLTYIGNRIDRDVILILKPTYAEINDLLESQRVDLAFVCTLAYVEGKEKFGMEILVAPQMYGETVYYSYLIVPNESDATSLSDLRGASFAFTDPMSNTGHLAPTYHLSLLGETPASFFGSYMYTYNHDNSVFAVADNLVDGAAVDSLVYDQLIDTNPDLADKIKIIDCWGPYGIPPVVINPAIDSQLKQKLQDLFLNLHSFDEGVVVLNNLGINKFVVVPDDIYDSIREMKRQQVE